MLSGRLLERVTYSQSIFLLYHTTMYRKTERIYLIITVCMPNLIWAWAGIFPPSKSVFFSIHRHRGLVHEQSLPLCFWVLLFPSSGANAKRCGSQQNFQGHLLCRLWRFLKLGGQSPSYFGVTCTVSALP